MHERPLLRECAPHRWRKLATLEFDRDRKSMSVICGPPPAAREATPSNSAASSGSGVRTRRAAAAAADTNNHGSHGGGAGGGNVLLVKGAAECLLARSTQARAPFLFCMTQAHLHAWVLTALHLILSNSYHYLLCTYRGT
jgi:magnesium-transporting ATPase (P-type)